MVKRAGECVAATVADVRPVWVAVLRVHARMLAELEARSAAAGVLPPTSLDLLAKLTQAPGRRVRMSDLAEQTFLSRGGVTRLVARLEADGLLRREPCAADGRGAFAVLTPAGSDALRRASPVYRQAIADRFAAHLTADQAAAAVDALGTVLAGNGWATPEEAGPVAPTIRSQPAGRR